MPLPVRHYRWSSATASQLRCLKLHDALKCKSELDWAPDLTELHFEHGVAISRAFFDTIPDRLSRILVSRCELRRAQTQWHVLL